MSRNGLALAAGGVKGFAHIAVLKLLEELELKIDVVTGSSAGSIVAALYALHGDWQKVWKEFSEGVVEFLPAFMKRAEKLRGANLWSIFQRSLVKVEEYYPFFKKLFGKKKFSDCKIKLGIVVFDITELRSLLITEGFLVDAVMASSSVPGVFEAVWIAGDQVVDGGVAGHTPVREARKLGADFIIASTFKKSASKLPIDQMELMFYIDTWKEEKIKNHDLSFANLVIEHDLAIDWYEFEKFKKVFETAVKSIEERRKEVEIIIRR
ncbi:MAG: patatin-like phospholipase family protein [Thermotogae bacterium]|nr:patatin-like phospholipase family protein [Thermotogota bacterium]